MRYIFALITLLVFVNVKAQDTTITTHYYPCDSSVTTTLPEKIYIYGYRSDTAYDAPIKGFYKWLKWLNLVGRKITTTALYDTIPAHDTTFNCNLCGTCSYTDTVIIPAAPLVIRANNQSKTYGQTFTFTNTGTQVTAVSGLLAGDVITADNAASTGAVATAVAGSYAITLSSIVVMRGATDVTNQYLINYQSGTLTVARLPITITADNQGKVAGQTFVFTHDGSQVDAPGLVSGDAVTADNAASTGSGSGAAAGSYAITLSSVTIKKGATDVTSSYNISYVPGTLTVTAAPLIITVTAKNQTKVYGQTFTFTHNGSQVNVTSGALVAGDVITVDNAASVGSGASASVGSYVITLSSITIMRGAVDVTGSYTITYTGGTLGVTAIPITVQANNQTKTLGDVFTFTHDGSQVFVVSGALLSGNAISTDNAASAGSGSGAVAGTYTITLSAVTIMNGVTNVTSNYVISYQPGTLTVVPVVPTNVFNGIFPNLVSSTGGPIPYGTRIGQVNIYDCNAFRNNLNVGNQWNVKQVLDSGHTPIMTYNDPACCQLNYFNTGAALETAKSTFTAYLNANQNAKPAVISFNNEEPNNNYWKGTVYDYLLTLNALTTIAHSYGIPTSNGGILQNIVYYMRYVYQQEGKTDSVNLINKRGQLFTGTGAAAQYFIDWYKVEIPGIAASQVDYVNFHWYEPSFNISTTSDTTTGLLPLVIQFLRSRTGKPVICTEFGSKYNSQALFNQVADEINNSGVYMRVYYYGTNPGPVSDPHPEWWKDWIDQNSP